MKFGSIPPISYDSKFVNDGFGKAVLHFVCTCIDGKFLPVISIVEVFPSEITPPCEVSPQCISSWSTKNEGTCRIFAGRILLDLNEALTWYLNLLNNGEWKRPDQIRDMSKKTINIKRFNLRPTNPWPYLNLYNSRSNVCYPFVPIQLADMAGIRFHSVLSLSPSIHGTVSRETLHPNLLETVKKFLDTDLAIWSEMVGSTHLLVHNPVLRKIRMSLFDTFIQIVAQPRCGVTFSDLKFFSPSSSKIGDISFFAGSLNAIIQIPHDKEPYENSIFICSEKHGLIYRSGPSTWVRSVNVAMNIVESRRRIINDEDGDIDDTIIDVIGHVSDISVSMPDNLSEEAEDLILKGHVKRSQKREINGGVERWFSGDISLARTDLRTILGSASKSILIVDPYFDRRALRKFGLHVSNRNVPIRILGSTLGFRSSDDGKENEYDLLKNELDRLRKSNSINSIKIRIIAGKNVIHDRFIVVDDKVWLLGSSLNSFGSRGTMLVQLRHPAIVLKNLEAEFKRAQKFEECRGNRETLTPPKNSCKLIVLCRKLKSDLFEYVKKFKKE